METSISLTISHDCPLQTIRFGRVTAIPRLVSRFPELPRHGIRQRHTQGIKQLLFQAEESTSFSGDQ